MRCTIRACIPAWVVLQDARKALTRIFMLILGTARIRAALTANSHLLQRKVICNKVLDSHYVK